MNHGAHREKVVRQQTPDDGLIVSGI